MIDGTGWEKYDDKNTKLYQSLGIRSAPQYCSKSRPYIKPYCTTYPSTPYDDVHFWKPSDSTRGLYNNTSNKICIYVIKNNNNIYLRRSYCSYIHTSNWSEPIKSDVRPLSLHTPNILRPYIYILNTAGLQCTYILIYIYLCACVCDGINRILCSRPRHLFICMRIAKLISLYRVFVQPPKSGAGARHV